MPTHDRASNEIVEFLEGWPDILSNLPVTARGHWQEAIAACKSTKPDRDLAKLLCDHIETVLRGLRGTDADLRQLDKIHSLVSILQGAIFLGKRDLSTATYYFDQGARRLRHWDDKALESLAYFGKALTHKEEESWSKAHEAAQKSQDAINSISMSDKAIFLLKHLQNRIDEEIDIITKSSIVDKRKTKTSFPGPRVAKPTPPAPIPILSRIAAGVGIINDSDIREHLFLSDYYRNEAHFGVIVVGDSMTGSGIWPGDVALIHQQPSVKDGEIAAILITTPKGTREVIKEYYILYEKDPQKMHWLLRSTNPSSEHLVVIPSGVNEDELTKLYAKKVTSKIIPKPPEYIRDANITIAGKYVGLVRRA
ncbi:MAG: S24 family peptidase [Anaerolineae bacterium]|nr:S24 family peptidase [Anaerolineae bacterium]